MQLFVLNYLYLEGKKMKTDKDWTVVCVSGGVLGGGGVNSVG